jgi:hypothetical protein
MTTRFLSYQYDACVKRDEHRGPMFGLAPERMVWGWVWLIFTLHGVAFTHFMTLACTTER